MRTLACHVTWSKSHDTMHRALPGTRGGRAGCVGDGHPWQLDA